MDLNDIKKQEDSFGSIYIIDPEDHENNGNNRIETNSSITQFLSCPRSYFYAYEVGIESKKVNFGVLFGSIIHDVLEYLYINKSKLNEDMLLLALTNLSNLKFDEHLRVFGGDTEVENKLNELKLLAQNIIKHYLMYWRNDYLQAIATEKEFSIRIDRGNESYYFAGKIDMYAKDLRNGQFVLVDHKTSSSPYFTTGMRSKIAFSTQLNLYALGLMAHHGVKVDSAYYNILYKKEPTVKELKNGLPSVDKSVSCTAAFYKEHLKNNSIYQDLIKKDMSLVDKYLEHLGYINEKDNIENKFFNRVGVCVDRDAVAETVSDFIGTCDMIRLCRKNNNYPQNMGNCTSFGGCEFSDICNSPHANRQVIIQNDFKHKSKAHMELKLNKDNLNPISIDRACVAVDEMKSENNSHDDSEFNDNVNLC